MPIGIGLGAAIAGGTGLLGGIVGDIFSSQGQSATNAMNMQIAQMNNQFNAQQAQLNRNFQQQMSDTAMTRRVADLRAAGLNPLLAVGQQGASTPGGASAQSVGLPQVNNPMASFGQLGQQMSGAASAAANYAQANLAQTQANKIAGVDTDLTKAQTQTQATQQVLQQAQAQAANAQASLSMQEVRESAARIPNIQQDLLRLQAVTDNVGADTILKDLQADFQGLSNKQFQYMMPDVLANMAATAKNNQLQIPGNQSMADFWSGKLGSASPYIQSIMPILKTLMMALK